MSFEERDPQSLEHEKNPDSRIVQFEPEPTDAVDTLEPPVEDGKKIKGLKEKIQQIFQRTEDVNEKTAEKEQMAQAIKLLRKRDRKFDVIDSKLQNRQKWFGGRFVQGSGLMRRGEELMQERKSLATENFASFLERYSLEPIPFFKAVERGGPSRNFAERLQENIIIIEELEGKLPGACQRLSRDYGIRNFSRYPVGMLIEQLEGEEDMETPYGLALFSQNDWNNGINQTSHLDLEELDEKTKKAGLKVRIIECRGLVDTAKRLIALNKKYGEHQKMQFAYVVGHGSEKSIELGDRSLEVESLPENALKKIGEFFVEKPTVILHACSTGKEESGIAHMLAQTLDAEVIGSVHDIHGLEIQSIEKTGEGYKFHTVFESATLFDMWTKREKPKPFRRQQEE